MWLVPAQHEIKYELQCFLPLISVNCSLVEQPEMVSGPAPHTCLSSPLLVGGAPVLSKALCAVLM